MEWLLYAFGSAVFAGLTAVLSKIGVRGYGLGFGHRGPYRSGSCVFVDYGVPYRFSWFHRNHKRQNLSVSGTVRRGHRGFLAVLFQGPSAGGM